MDASHVYGGPCNRCGILHPAGECPDGFPQVSKHSILGKRLCAEANKAFGYRECLRVLLLGMGIDDVSATRLLDLARDRHVSEFMAELAASKQGGA